MNFDAARVSSIPRTFIDCNNPALPTIAVMRQRVRQEPGWRNALLARADAFHRHRLRRQARQVQLMRVVVLIEN